MSKNMAPREAFEAYQSRKARALIDGGEGHRVRDILHKMNFEDFCEGWQAARAALVVELPPNNWDDSNYAEDVIMECAKAITKTGVRVK